MTQPCLFIISAFSFLILHSALCILHLLALALSYAIFVPNFALCILHSAFLLAPLC